MQGSIIFGLTDCSNWPADCGYTLNPSPNDYATATHESGSVWLVTTVEDGWRLYPKQENIFGHNCIVVQDAASVFVPESKPTNRTGKAEIRPCKAAKNPS